MCLLQPRVGFHRGPVPSRFRPLLLVLSGKTDRKPEAEGERKISMNFEELLAVPCASISAVVTGPSHDVRNQGVCH